MNKEGQSYYAEKDYIDMFLAGDNFGSSQFHRGVHLEVIDGPHPDCQRSGSSRSDLGVVGM